MDCKILVTIIVPVYNAEKCLEKCLNSLLEQTYRNIEIVLINDGSTDNSLNICNSFRRKCDFIKVINKKNEGVSIARNIGIEHSNGDYIIFVDSDDYVDKYLVEKMLKIFIEKNIDWTICGYKKVFFNKGKITKEKIINYEEKFFETKDDTIKYLYPLYNSKGFNALWNKMYKTEIIQKKKIKFNPNINMGEDYIFNLNYLTAVNRLYIMNENLYRYRIEDNILTNKFEDKLFKNRMVIYNETINTLKKCGFDYNEVTFDMLYIKFVYAQLMMLSHKHCNYDKEKKFKIIEDMIQSYKTQEIVSKSNSYSKTYWIMCKILKIKSKRFLLFIGKIMKYIKKMYSKFEV